MTAPNTIDLDPTPLDDEEKAVMAAFEKGLDEAGLVSALTDKRRAEIESSAHATMNPPKVQVTTLLAKQDLSRLKSQALELGMPYQALLGSIVHQYVEGDLVRKK